MVDALSVASPDTVVTPPLVLVAPATRTSGADVGAGGVPPVICKRANSILVVPGEMVNDFSVVKDVVMAKLGLLSVVKKGPAIASRSSAD